MGVMFAIRISTLSWSMHLSIFFLSWLDSAPNSHGSTCHTRLRDIADHGKAVELHSFGEHLALDVLQGHGVEAKSDDENRGMVQQ